MNFIVASERIMKLQPAKKMNLMFTESLKILYLYGIVDAVLEEFEWTYCFSDVSS